MRGVINVIVIKLQQQHVASFKQWLLLTAGSQGWRQICKKTITAFSLVVNSQLCQTIHWVISSA